MHYSIYPVIPRMKLVKPQLKGDDEEDNDAGRDTDTESKRVDERVVHVTHEMTVGDDEEIFKHKAL